MVKAMTESNLRSAYGGESQAHMRYLIFAGRARKNGFTNVARLFEAVAYAEQVHATNHFKNIQSKGDFLVVSGALFGSRSTVEDLEAAIAGETFEVEEMYPAYLEVAKAQGERGAEQSFTWALEAEKIHAELYKKAKEAVEQGKDADFERISICSVCGHTVAGEPPERCPVCNASKEMYKAF
jgi:rubrerythrin